MYIKQVIVQGFKSYREQTVLEPFDPGHNVIGRNGSGKSNLFEAIQFVLSDEYSRLGSAQLQSLLHEGTGPRVISAYVEIIFDNTDGRIPIGKNEVYLRRLFGSKKDQYYLNKKLVTRNDVLNLLESAGFSKSNPYYIVRQGKINQMATAPDSQRLKVLREVAGTRVYDDRCKESNKLLKEAEAKLEKINDLLIIIGERLQNLEEETEELREFQRWDNQRRYLEFTIYDRELKENKKNLHELEESRTEMKPMLIQLNDKAKSAQEAVRACIKFLKEAKKEVISAKEEKDVLSSEQQELLKKKTKLTLMITDLREEIVGDNDGKEKAEQELEMLRIQITDREGELERIKPQYEEIKSIEDECTKELALKEQKRKELYAKLGRVSQFANREERNEWIHSEINQLVRQIRDKENHQAKLNDDLQNDLENQKELKRKINVHTHEMEFQTDSMHKYNEKYEEMTKAKDECQAARKEQYRKESLLHSKLDGLKEDLEKIDRSLRSMVGNLTLNGRDSVRKVIETFRERGDTENEVSSYYGLLMENFDCDKSIYTAVEVTAGNRLFHHLIETDSFSTKILKEMNKLHLPGEVSFMPLNRVISRVSEYPKTEDAVPMLSKIIYDPKFDKAFRYIFGRTLICRNLETASKLARSSGLDCVTMEGDRVYANGLLTGGYFDFSRSRMDAHMRRSELIARINGLKEELKTLKEEILETDKNIVSYTSKMQKAELGNSRAIYKLKTMKADVQNKKTELSTIEGFRKLKEESLAQCAISLEEMNTTREGLQNELDQELSAQLSTKDQQQVDALNEDIRRLTRENKEAFAKRMSLEVEKNKLENLLTNNLVRRREELVQALQELSVVDRQRKFESCNARFGEVEYQLKKIDAELQTQNEKVLNAVKRQKAEFLELETRKLAEKETKERIEAISRDLDKLASKQNVIQLKINKLTQKIAELEALPSHETFGKFTNMSTKQLLNEIERTNMNLKKYSQVNKRALEQFLSFTDQKEKLSTRKEELDKGYERIKELMTVLKHQKCEATLFTFKQVSRYFTEVFEKLVPFGQAELIMQTTDGEEEAASETSVQESTASNRFSGIGIRVSFTAQKTKMKEMNQLSGGQKAIVALAMIFAIQKCDPAPFYLFDEIDQSLDSQHRIAVANIIHELSASAQFITTTFRPELLARANKFYGVKFRNKVSHVECVTLEQAAEFVEDDETHN